MPPLSSTILVVDDDELQRDLVSMQLSSLGYSQVLVAASGHAALAQLDIHPHAVRLIISDLSMPDMDGLVLMRHLAQRGFNEAIIVLSGMQDDLLSSAVGLANAHGLKVLGCLPKPSNIDTLRRLLDSLCTSADPGKHAQPNPALAPDRLAAALAAGEFVAWYQPKVDLRTGLAFGVEALARWPQADGSLIGPNQFVPAMEAAGLADELFFAMAREAAASLTMWHAQGVHIKAAVNLSMDTALNLTVPDRLSQIISAAGLACADLVIEITESRLMGERSVAMESLTRLSLLGFSLSIDDFGTGYSSLVQLIDLPFNELKIDGSFVQRASHELKAQTVLRIATLLGHNLKMDVIAEGVETPEQLAFLRDCGCTLVQGYYFAKPMPFDQCTPWLHARQAAHA
jgi:EAL domain-containing protein (putative c-di-GMP-specific phosphodiesterase class I)/ActR/RegA family two-component response regulator